MKEWLKKSLAQLTEGLMKNLGTAIAAFVASGGYLVAVAKLGEFQTWVRGIPTDYVLTPLVLLVIALAVIVRVNVRQKRELHRLTEQPKLDDEPSRLVTHYGVWWKLYPDADYMEDFPYCSCCTPARKLVQTDWHPEEKFKCSSTGTVFQLYDGVPWDLATARKSLYDAYFRATWLEERFHKEWRRLKELNPDMSEEELLPLIVKSKPYSNLPAEDLAAVIRRFPKPLEFIFFLRRNMHHYRPLLVVKEEK